MASNSFIAMCGTSGAKPRLYFEYASSNYSTFVKSISPLERANELASQYVTIELNNTEGTFDDFLTVHTELAQKAVVKWGFGNYVNRAGATTISFHENTPNADTIEDSAELFLDNGFEAGAVIRVDDDVGVGINDGNYTCASVTEGVITLIATDDLANEAAGDATTIQSELLNLFTGYVEKVIHDCKTGIMTITIRDRLSQCLEKQVISDDQETEVKYNWFDAFTLNRQDAKTVSNLVWEILTTYGDLDDTASTANTDIDYDSWVAWGVAVDGGTYSIFDLGMVANGETVATVLDNIKRLTESMIWQGSDGKLKFLSSYQTVVGQSLTTADIINATWQVSLEGRINIIWVKSKYLPELDYFYNQDWYDVDAYGPTTEPYIYQTEWESDRCVFHNSGSGSSAQYYTQEKLARTAPPIRIWMLESHLLGFVVDVGDTIILSGLYSDPEIIVTNVRMDIMNCTSTIIGYQKWVFP